MTDPFFNATNIFVGNCKEPGCAGVHIQLLDAGGVTRAQAVIGCDAIDCLVADLEDIRDSILSGRAIRAEVH